MGRKFGISGLRVLDCWVCGCGAWGVGSRSFPNTLTKKVWVYLVCLAYILNKQTVLAEAIFRTLLGCAFVIDWREPGSIQPLQCSSWDLIFGGPGGCILRPPFNFEGVE